MKHRVWIGIIIGLIVLFVVSGTTTLVRDALMPPLIHNEQPRPADVIIVLGSGTHTGGDHLGPQAKQRVLEGLALAKKNFASTIIMSGGRDRNTNLVESDEMVAYALRQGHSAATIIAEEHSRDTYENAKFSLMIMRDQGWKTVLVVTSPYHTWRACRIFHAQQADVHCVAAPFSLYPPRTFAERLMDTKSVVREYGAVVYNWLKGEL